MRAVAWDATAERLAVSLGAGGADGASVALFATSLEPVLTARLIGFVRDEPRATGGARGGGNGAASPSDSGPAAAEKLPEAGAAGGEGTLGQQQVGQGVRAGEAAVAFQPSFGGGSLLAVRRNDTIRVLPLYFTA